MSGLRHCELAIVKFFYSLFVSLFVLRPLGNEATCPSPCCIAATLQLHEERQHLWSAALR